MYVNIEPGAARLPIRLLDNGSQVRSKSVMRLRAQLPVNDEPEGGLEYFRDLTQLGGTTDTI
jgi:hypothetical protein